MNAAYAAKLNAIANDIAYQFIATLAVAGKEGAIGLEEALYFLDEDEVETRRENDSLAWRELTRQIMLALATEPEIDYRPQDALYIAVEIDRIIRVHEFD